MGKSTYSMIDYPVQPTHVRLGRLRSPACVNNYCTLYSRLLRKAGMFEKEHVFMGV